MARSFRERFRVSNQTLLCAFRKGVFAFESTFEYRSYVVFEKVKNTWLPPLLYSVSRPILRSILRIRSQRCVSSVYSKRACARLCETTCSLPLFAEFSARASNYTRSAGRFHEFAGDEAQPSRFSRNGRQAFFFSITRSASRHLQSARRDETPRMRILFHHTLDISWSETSRRIACGSRYEKRRNGE